MKVQCNVILDLIPLVRDNVASEESNHLVYNHIKDCKSCREEFENTNIICENAIDDKKIIQSIKRSLFLTGMVFMVCGALLGVYLSNSLGMFYNFLIMPIVGGFGYLTLKRRWYLTPLGIFTLTYGWVFIKSILEGALAGGLPVEIFWLPMFLSSVYTGLTVLGIVIAALIKFALKKEEI